VKRQSRSNPATGLRLPQSRAQGAVISLTKNGFVSRLKDHLFDRRKGEWDPVSWFGFCIVLKAKGENGLSSEVGAGSREENASKQRL
jgi:hypothetical protein